MNTTSPTSCARIEAILGSRRPRRVVHHLIEVTATTFSQKICTIRWCTNRDSFRSAMESVRESMGLMVVSNGVRSRQRGERIIPVFLAARARTQSRS